MSGKKQITKRISRGVNSAVSASSPHIKKTATRAARAGKKAAKVSAVHSVKFAKVAHRNLATKPHAYMKDNWAWYAKWHNWKWHRVVHYSTLGGYLLLVGLVLFSTFRIALAADLTNTWDFSTPGDYSLDSGVEIDGNSARLKAQEYSSDANTAALYHLNESSGTNIADSSSYANDGTASSAPTWGAGNLNGAATFNGTNQRISTPDSASLSFTGQHSLEGWFKPSSTFNSSSSQNMSILNKGNYRAGLDRTSGKLTYESQSSSAGDNWTRRMGNGQSGSWTHGHYGMGPSTSYGTDVYTAIGNQYPGDAEVWKWNGTTWTQIGGDTINSSWADQTYEEASAIAVNGTYLYVGLGTSTGDGEVWTCNLATSCSSWSKIGGDGNGPGTGVEIIYSMVSHAGSLYIGTGNSASDGIVWRYNGSSSWTQMAGGAVNSSWNTGYESVRSLASDGTNLYAGIGDTTTEAEVWKYNGSIWSQIGGDGTNSSWNTSFEYVSSLTWHNGKLYAGLGSGGGDGNVWEYNGTTTWTQIGGGAAINSSWNSTTSTAQRVESMVSDGTNLYVGLYNTGAGLWRYNGSSWTQIGGGNATTSWNTSVASSLVFVNSKLYAAAWSTNTGSAFYEWDGAAWTNMGGNFVNNSWGGYNVGTVGTSAVYNGKLYTSMGNVNAQVYEYNGTSSTRVGGSGLNNSWPAGTYETVNSMITYNGKLYVGLGWNSADAEIWTWDGTTWAKVAGDGLSSTWSTNTIVSSMTVLDGNLYVGLGGGNTADADVWRYNGSVWTQIGGDNLNSGWNNAAKNVAALVTYDNKVCAGLESAGTVNTGNAWCWSGSSWTQIGGGASINSGWASATVDGIATLAVYNGELYAGVSEVTSINSSVWKYNGSTWTKVGGNSMAGSWGDGTYPHLNAMAVYNGELYLGTGNVAAGSGDVWRYNGTTWSQVAGDGVNNSWAANTIEAVVSLTTYKGKLYAGTGSTANTDAYVWSIGNNTYLESTTSSFANSWNHFAITNDGGTAKLYINGTQEASSSATSTTDNSLPLLIGSGYGTTKAGDGVDFFAGSLDEIRVSDIARTIFTTKPYSDTEQGVVLASSVRRNGVKDWETFTSNETLNGGAVTYRLSDDDGTTWKYWNGSAWATSSSLTQANAASVITANIATFPVTFDGIKWTAVLKGDGTQQVTLNSVELGSNSDVTAPGANASDIVAAKSNGGSALSSGAWTNGSSPYFSWTAGTDAGAGILGYCLYLGQSSTDDPVSSKGLLGTGTLDVGSSCQFAVAGTNLDLATAGLLGTALTSSSSNYYLNIKAIDRAGNVASSSEQFSFRFDNTAPNNPGYASAPSGFINTKTATITWPTTGGNAASDANSGVLGLQYRIGSSSWYGDSHTGTGDVNDLLTNDGTYTTVDPPDFDNLEDGINTVYFRTWDQAGNYTTSYTTAVIKVNTSGAPSEPQNVVASPSTSTTNSFAFSWDAPVTFNTTTGNADKLTYCYVINTLPNSGNCNFTAAGVTSLSASAYATQPGSNTLYVVAKDDFDSINYSSYSTATFTANTSAPGIAANIDAADVSVKTTSNWRLAVTWDAPTDVGAGVSAYKVFRSTDNVSFAQVGTSSSTSYVDSGLSQVRYYYQVKACDSANNCGAFTSVVSEIPTGKYTDSAVMTSEPVVSNVTTKRASIAWSTDRASDSKIVIGTTSGEYSPSEVGNSSQVIAHNIDLDNLAAGTTYYFQAKWTDVDGNTGTSQEYSFTTAPAPLLKEVNTIAINLSGVTLEFTVKDATKVELQYGTTDSFGGVKSINTSMTESTYNLELDGLNDGVKYFYRIIMKDSEGGTYQSSIFSFTTPPRPSISNLRFQPLTGEPTSTQQVTWTTNIPTSSAVSYGKVGTNGTIIQVAELKSTHEIVIRGLEDNSEYFLIAQGRDGSGNLAVSDRQVFKTALDTRPPQISDIVIEPTIRGTGAEARGQIVVSWKTDEPSTSQVAFGEGSAVTVFNSRTAEDAQLTTEHLVIISDLPPSKVYSIMPVSKDKSGNSSETAPQAAIVGRASDSVLNIVLNTLRKVFGL